MNSDSEYLVGLSDGELEALASGMLAPSAQARLDELLLSNNEGRISPKEQGELDRVLEQIDQLTLLKARAQYTLHQRVAASRS